jgi:hypothetical protein
VLTVEQAACAIADGIEHLHAELGKARAELDEVARLHAAGVRIQASQAKRLAQLKRVARAAIEVDRNADFSPEGRNDYAVDAIVFLRLNSALRAAGFLEDQEPCQHQWATKRQGGDPAEAGSYERVTFCDKCGMEYDGEEAVYL